MRPYVDANGKAWYHLFWEDKVNKQLKKLFKKSARQQGKKECSNY